MSLSNYLGKLEKESLVVYIINVLQTNANESTRRIYNVSLLEHSFVSYIYLSRRLMTVARTSRALKRCFIAGFSGLQ